MIRMIVLVDMAPPLPKDRYPGCRGARHRREATVHESYDAELN